MFMVVLLEAKHKVGMIKQQDTLCFTQSKHIFFNDYTKYVSLKKSKQVIHIECRVNII